MAGGQGALGRARHAPRAGGKGRKSSPGAAVPSAPRVGTAEPVSVPKPRVGDPQRAPSWLLLRGRLEGAGVAGRQPPPPVLPVLVLGAHCPSRWGVMRAAVARLKALTLAKASARLRPAGVNHPPAMPVAALPSQPGCPTDPAAPSQGEGTSQGDGDVGGWCSGMSWGDGDVGGRCLALGVMTGRPCVACPGCGAEDEPVGTGCSADGTGLAGAARAQRFLCQEEVGTHRFLSREATAAPSHWQPRVAVGYRGALGPTPRGRKRQASPFTSTPSECLGHPRRAPGEEEEEERRRSCGLQPSSPPCTPGAIWPR